MLRLDPQVHFKDHHCAAPPHCLHSSAPPWFPSPTPDTDGRVAVLNGAIHARHLQIYLVYRAGTHTHTWTFTKTPEHTLWDGAAGDRLVLSRGQHQHMAKHQRTGGFGCTVFINQTFCPGSQREPVFTGTVSPARDCAKTRICNPVCSDAALCRHLSNLLTPPGITIFCNSYLIW